MLVIKIWNFFRGYVIIRIEGLTLERFINLAIAKGIYLWDIICYDQVTLEAKIGISGFRELRDVVKKVGCRITIKEKRGYPFMLHKMKYRKMFAIGFIVALSIVFYLTSFIWTIDIIGNEKISEEYVTKILEDMDIKTWIAKKNINTLDIKKKLLYDINNLAYAHAEIKGTKLIIEIKEKRDKIEEYISGNDLCNIIATKNAIVEKIIAKKGNAVVEKGDVVKKGEVLITGIIEDERLEEPLFVHSEGTIIGRTKRIKIIEEPITKIIKEETGKEYIVREFRLLDKKIEFFGGDIPFTNYIEKIETKEMFGNLKEEVPVEIIIHKYKEVNIKKVKQNIDSLKKSIMVKGVQSIMKELPKEAKVVAKDIRYSIDNDILIARVSVETMEEIGADQKIQYNEDE